LLRNTLKHFLTVSLEPGTTENDALSSRCNLLDQHIISIPRNTEDMELLQQAGYSPLLWSKVNAMYHLGSDSHGVDKELS